MKWLQDYSSLYNEMESMLEVRENFVNWKQRIISMFIPNDQ